MYIPFLVPLEACYRQFKFISSLWIKAIVIRHFQSSFKLLILRSTKLSAADSESFNS